MKFATTTALCRLCERRGMAAIREIVRWAVTTYALLVLLAFAAALIDALVR